jgi:hypothetical protein
VANCQDHPLSIARRLWQHARPSGTALALDSGTGFVCNRAKWFGAAPWSRIMLEIQNLASIIAVRPTDP